MGVDDARAELSAACARRSVLLLTSSLSGATIGSIALPPDSTMASRSFTVHDSSNDDTSTGLAPRYDPTKPQHQARRGWHGVIGRRRRGLSMPLLIPTKFYLSRRQRGTDLSEQGNQQRAPSTSRWDVVLPTE